MIKFFSRFEDWIFFIKKNFSSNSRGAIVKFGIRSVSHYLYFVVLPQGVRGYLMDFVLPPWG